MKRLVLLITVLALAACFEDPPEPAERWLVQELGTNADFRDVYFIDERSGWIVGGGHNIEGGLLGTTSDGGRTWSFRDRITTTSRRSSSFHLNAVHFLDENLGFAAGDGGQLLRSIDGGEHWHAVARRGGVAAHLAALHFHDRLHGWAVGPGGFLRTEDGGEHWTGTDDGTRVNGTDIQFVDRERGVIGDHRESG